MSEQQTVRAALRVGNVGSGFTGAALEVVRRLAHVVFLRAVQLRIKRHGHTDTGGLLRSFRVVERAAGEGRAVFVASEAPQANILDKGGRIVPVRARMLTVPVAKIARHRRARDFPDAFIVRTRRGKLLLARSKGKRRRKLEVLFVLRDMVRLRGSGYLRGAEEDARGQAPAFIERELALRLQHEADK